MIFNVYADLSRALSEYERDAIADALDSTVPDSGCVGLQGGPFDEVYFTVTAANLDDARKRALTDMNTVLEQLQMEIEFSLELTSQING